MATGTIKRNNYVADVIINTGSSTSVTYTGSLDKYDFIYASMGAGTGSYASGIIPTSVIGSKNGLQLFVFGASGQFTARGNINFSTKTVTTTDVSYPVYMYGIRKA